MEYFYCFTDNKKGNVTELALTEDKPIRVYVGIDNDGKIEYDENKILTVKLSEVNYVHGKINMKKVTVGEVQKMFFLKQGNLLFWEI